MKHIAIFREPFYSFVINGKKTIESRWSNKKIAPFGKVNKGDELLIKKTGGKVAATAKVGRAEYFNLTPQIAHHINKTYGKEICTNYFDDWEKYASKKYCTLIWLEDVKIVKEFSVKKSNGAGWIVVKENK